LSKPKVRKEIADWGNEHVVGKKVPRKLPTHWGVPKGANYCRTPIRRPTQFGGGKRWYMTSRVGP